DKIHVVIFLVSITLIAGCDNYETPPKGHEIDNKNSPDNLNKAFIWAPELGGLGATMSQPYQVWLHNIKGGRLSLIFEADKLDGVELTWLSTRELEICYSRAQIYHFRNFFVIAEEHSPGIYRVEIVLKKVSDLGYC
ncbi:MAG TPA: hypothetical protein VIC08_10130, partial [Cellvibrionaceae bacterium]